MSKIYSPGACDFKPDLFLHVLFHISIKKVIPDAQAELGLKFKASKMTRMYFIDHSV